MAAKRQNDAYQAVLSPLFSSGRLGMYQPLMTSCRKPLARRRSLWTRVMSFARMAAAPFAFCRPCRISRDSASFSEGEAMPVLKLVFGVVRILVYCVLLLLVYYVVPYLVYCVERFLVFSVAALPTNPLRLSFFICPH